MNWDQIEGNFKQFTGKVKEKFGLLTDDEIMATRGRRDALSGRIQERYGYEADRAEKELDTFVSDLERSRGGVGETFREPIHRSDI